MKTQHQVGYTALFSCTICLQSPKYDFKWFEFVSGRHGAKVGRTIVLAGKVTLSTIAEQLGVSTATVSLALRDSPLVADATRERIKEAAAKSGYIYNRRAASLRTSRSGIVGVLVPDIMNPFFAEILLGHRRGTWPQPPDLLPVQSS